METINHYISKLQKAEFEARIFVSMSIVLLVSLLSFLCFPSLSSNMTIAGSWFGLLPHTSVRTGYIFLAGLMLLASLIRMWAGSMLTSRRVMAFKVQNDKLTIKGPYLLVRNPIYLADLIAFCGFAFCLKPIGLMLPVLLYIHYYQLVTHEEKNLANQFGEQFQLYKRSTPRFLPTVAGIKRFLKARKEFGINIDGFRHNALYLLFVPGFILTAFTGNLLHAVITGMPAIIDWAIVHTLIGVSPQTVRKQKSDPAKTKKTLSKSRVFADILYAQCWEDPGIDRKAFKIRPDDVLFSITSGGCNVLTFLLDNPKKIVALDLNPCQNYLLDLKMAAFKMLSYDQLLEFMGVTQSGRRMEMYADLRTLLTLDSREYWDCQPEKIRAGVIHSGRYEKYMHLLKKVFCILMGKSLIRELFETRNATEREVLYREKWNKYRWRFFTGFFLSRLFMTLLFDKAFFAQLGNSFSFGKHFRQIIKRAITELPVDENYFFAYILTGKYNSHSVLPHYLRKENYEIIRKRIDRIQMVNGSCEEYFKSLPGEYFSKFNFTNIFEWMPEHVFEKLLRKTIWVARHNSIITYRNLLVPRSRPESLAAWIIPKKKTSDRLHKTDLSFIYKAYVVEQIKK